MFVNPSLGIIHAPEADKGAGGGGWGAEARGSDSKSQNYQLICYWRSFYLGSMLSWALTYTYRSNIRWHFVFFCKLPLPWQHIYNLAAFGRFRMSVTYSRPRSPNYCIYHANSRLAISYITQECDSSSQPLDWFHPKFHDHFAILIIIIK